MPCSKHQLSELTVAVSMPFYHVAVSQGLGTTEFTNLIALQPSSCQILLALGKSLFLFFYLVNLADNLPGTEKLLAQQKIYFNIQDDWVALFFFSIAHVCLLMHITFPQKNYSKPANWPLKTFASWFGLCRYHYYIILIFMNLNVVEVKWSQNQWK